MRLEHPTLDGLDCRASQDEVEVALACIADAEQSESLARSFGL